MKTALPLVNSFKKTLVAATAFFSAATTFAQNTVVPELSFKNAVLESGTNGVDGAVYRFKDVTTDIDALVYIAGRSSSTVRLVNLDISSTGSNNAWQPQIAPSSGSSAARNTTWWMDFDVRFVRKNSSTPVQVNAFDVSALDIDGDNNSLREMVSFYNASTYTVESNTQLTSQQVTATVFGQQTLGREFTAPLTSYAGISATETRVIASLRFTNKSFFRVRIGGKTGNQSSSEAERQNSLWFRGLDFTTPVESTLPVKLSSFTATLNQGNADLKWVTSMEKNVSHFEVERSFDGRDYKSIGMVFAFGNTDEKQSYSFIDKQLDMSKSGVVYYRLRSVDIDKKSEYSQVRLIHISKQGTGALSIITYPNPAVNSVSVTVPAAWQGKAISYELISQSGQLITSRKPGAASQTETFDISRLNSGFYIIRVNCEGETVQQKIVKQ